MVCDQPVLRIVTEPPHAHDRIIVVEKVANAVVTGRVGVHRLSGAVASAGPGHQVASGRRSCERWLTEERGVVCGSQREAVIRANVVRRPRRSPLQSESAGLRALYLQEHHASGTAGFEYRIHYSIR